MKFVSPLNKIIRVIALSLATVAFLFLAGCGGDGKKTDKKAVTVNDTTAIGKLIAEVSVKIGQEPGNASLYHERAKLHMQRMDVGNALLDMGKATELDSTKADFFVTLGDAYFASGKPGKSKAALEKCLSIDPNNKDAYQKLAELYFYATQYKEALGNLDKVIKLDINSSKAYFMKGMCYRDMGDTAKAISSFQTAIEQKADYYDAFLQIAMMHHARNNKLALQYYDAAIRVNPKSTDAFYGRGLYHQEVEHDFDKAIQDYTSCVQINKNAIKAHFALGFVHYEYLKVYDQAIKHYTDAINVDPNYAEAIYNRGLCYEALGNIAAAAQDYRRAIDVRKDYPLAKDALARVEK